MFAKSFKKVAGELNFTSFIIAKTKAESQIRQLNKQNGTTKYRSS